MHLCTAQENVMRFAEHRGDGGRWALIDFGSAIPVGEWMQAPYFSFTVSAAAVQGSTSPSRLVCEW
jgi:hypothetical protein